MVRQSKIEAFRHFGVDRLKTPYMWSAQAPDGQIILALWRDRFVERKPTRYSNFQGDPPAPEWINRAGNIERRAHLIRAADERDGLFRVVLLTAKDKDSSPRETLDAQPDDMTMKITRLDRVTGEFEAVEVI
jgi:hypothetical protein